MKVLSFIPGILGSMMALCFLSTADAGSPLWTFTPLTETTLSVLSGETYYVQYKVTNQSSRVHTLTMQPIQGITQQTTGPGICGNPFVLTGKAFCTLSLQVNGSQLTQPILDGPIVCEQGSILQCYRPASANILHITQATDAGITLTNVSPSSGAASGGTGVTLMGTGLTGATSVTFGGAAATSVNVVDSTRVTAVTPAHAVGAVDVVITTPSGSATYSSYTYETTAVGQPAYGGKIACLNGGFNNLIAATADNDMVVIWGDDNETTGATSITNGAENTDKIVDALGVSTNYAARVCSEYAVDSQGNAPCQQGNACYSDWFLPAGNNTGISGQLNCLYVNKTNIGGFASTPYWSSTENDQFYANAQNFSNGTESNFSKNFPLHVRCVRGFTP